MTLKDLIAQRTEMTLKDVIARDTRTFINLNEFAEIVEINDIKIPAILIKKTGNVGNTNIASKHAEYYVHPELHNEPIIGEYVTVYFKTADYVKDGRRIPQNLEYCRINGVRYKVAESTDEMGITRLDCTTDRMPTPQMRRLPGLYE